MAIERPVEFVNCRDEGEGGSFSGAPKQSLFFLGQEVCVIEEEGHFSNLEPWIVPDPGRPLLFFEGCELSKLKPGNVIQITKSSQASPGVAQVVDAYRVQIFRDRSHLLRPLLEVFDGVSDDPPVEIQCVHTRQKTPVEIAADRSARVQAERAPQAEVTEDFSFLSKIGWENALEDLSPIIRGRLAVPNLCAVTFSILYNNENTILICNCGHNNVAFIRISDEEGDAYVQLVKNENKDGSRGGEGAGIEYGDNWYYLGDLARNPRSGSSIDGEPAIYRLLSVPDGLLGEELVGDSGAGGAGPVVNDDVVFPENYVGKFIEIIKNRVNLEYGSYTNATFQHSSIMVRRVVDGYQVQYVATIRVKGGEEADFKSIDVIIGQQMFKLIRSGLNFYEMVPDNTNLNGETLVVDPIQNEFEHEFLSPQANDEEEQEVDSDQEGGDVYIE